MPYRSDNNIDELLRQADELLGEEPRDGSAYFHPPEPEDTAVYPNFSNNYGANYQNQPDDDNDGDTWGEPAIPAYNADFRGTRRGAARSGPAVSAPERGYAYLPDDEAYPETYAPAEETPRRTKPAKKPKRKKKHRLLKFLLVLAILLGGLAVWLFSIIRQPETDRPIGQRKSGAASILICGTDEEGYRTDTMMLLYLNARENAVNLISLPRDTLTYTTAGNYAKLNSAFGRNDGANDPEQGMDELLGYVADIVGYRPDGYVLVSLDVFVDMVDLMGGVEFDVPQDMYYADAQQDLLIDLEAGLQTLNGEQAMGLVRFRKGYANQDLGRVEVQREFISACMDQWLTLGNLTKLPQALSLFLDSTTTDLTRGNLLSIAWTAWRAGLDNVHSETLPGYADMIDGASYYVLDREGVARLINDYANPYLQDIDASDLNIAG